jgi:SMODS and SLOG-associating 2TM effector domain 1/Protein of unknown function (DUF4231)
MAVLDTVADRQAQWSKTADQMKSTIDHARWWVFVLSILGAVLAAAASQMGAATTGAATAATSNPRAWVAIAAAVSLAFATFFTQRLLGADHVIAWVRARAISERLKREAFRFAAEAAPYDGPDRAKAELLLDDERQKIESDGDDLLGKQVPTTSRGSLPRGPLTKDEYIAQRVRKQIDYFVPNANKYQRISLALRRTELMLAAAATLITAVVSVTGKSVVWGMTFDLAALTAVLTTIAGAVLAHIEASRYDFLVMTYRATARRLEERANRSHEPWSDFVNDCENILSAENVSWIAKWTK